MEAVTDIPDLGVAVDAVGAVSDAVCGDHTGFARGRAKRAYGEEGSGVDSATVKVVLSSYVLFSEPRPGPSAGGGGPPLRALPSTAKCHLPLDCLYSCWQVSAPPGLLISQQSSPEKSQAY
jgi:hypothetical protein